ncbi:MAG: SDR family oxidoreductase [Burkholderiaceae bacterium]|nr:SDR family oxidoreductase [Burkholderiaceae bacterium]
MKRTVFFGARGYLGRHLVAALRASGHDVVVPTTADGGRLDLSDANSLREVSWDVQSVYVFAGMTGTHASFGSALDYVRANEVVLLNVLEAIRQSPFRPRVIFPSSRLVYRGANHPLSEDAEQEARTVYAANKIACERYLQAYASAHGVPYTIYRVCVPFGNSQGTEYSFGTMGNFIGQARRTGQIRLFGDGSVRRSFTHVDDLCRMVIAGAVHPGAENGVFNVPGEDLSLLEAAGCVAHRLVATITTGPWPAADLRIESGSTVFDGARLTTLLGDALTQRVATWASAIPVEVS